jgi:hypothetical protein
MFWPHSLDMLTPDLTPERIVELRRMTPEQKLEIAQRMYWDARRAKAVELRVLHADWSAEEVQAEVRRVFLAEAMKESRLDHLPQR